MTRIAISLLLVVLVASALLYWIGAGGPGERWEEGTPTHRAVAPATLAARRDTRAAAAEKLGVTQPKQILFGDFHVHSSFSLDAFAMALPIAGGEGARPNSQACDFARFCSGLDFWSVNDHAIEAPSLAIGADALGCTRDATGRCTALDACGERALDDDCLAATEERAWSSPIFVAHGGSSPGSSVLSKRGNLD